jgi:hypothetical protein
MLVEKAVNRFLDTPMEPGIMRMYTTAQSVVDQEAYRQHRYDTAIPKIDKNDPRPDVRSLAQRAFKLAGPLKILEGPNGSGRLFFNVRPEDKDELHRAGEMLRALRGLEVPDPEDSLYVEFARGALAKDLGKRREQVYDGYQRIASVLRHPTAKAHMTATGLHVVTRDMMYPLKDDDAPLPATD